MRIERDTGLGLVMFCAGRAPWHDDPAVLHRLRARLAAPDARQHIAHAVVKPHFNMLVMRGTLSCLCGQLTRPHNQIRVVGHQHATA